MCRSNRVQSPSPTALHNSLLPLHPGALLGASRTRAFSEGWIDSTQTDRPESRVKPLPRLGPGWQPPPRILSQPRGGGGNSQC